MKTFNRPYDEMQSDFKRMWDFLVDDCGDKKEGFIWTIGRIGDWKYGVWNEKKYFPSFLRNNAQLWYDSLNNLVGFVISENGDNYFTIFTRRGCEHLYPEMISWVKANWGDREGGLNTDVTEHQNEYAEMLEAAGFMKKELSGIARQYSLKEKVNEEIILDGRFTIRSFHENPDYAGKKILYKNGFHNENSPVTEFDLLQLKYNQESPCYNPRFDFSVMNEEGQHLATCVAFIDWKNNFAEVEKICTHGGFRRLGLAEAVIRECFKRLYAEGIEYAYITGLSNEAKSLYGKLGASKSVNLFNYTL